MDAASHVLIWCAVGMMLLLSYALHVDRKKIRALTKPTPKITKVRTFSQSDEGVISVSGRGSPPVGVNERFHASINGEIVPFRLTRIDQSWGYSPETEWYGIDEAALGRWHWHGDGEPQWAEDAFEPLPWSPTFDRRMLMAITIGLVVVVTYWTWQVLR